MDALLGRVVVLRPSGALRVDGVLRGHARGQGACRVRTLQFRFGHVEPTAVPGRKHQLYALRLGGWKGPEERGVRMCVQVVTDQDQALGLGGSAGG